MTNIKDVAQYAGVGLGTVSRYLNGYRVTEENRQKIEKAIHKLNYSVNPIARSMKTKKSMTVAVVVPRLADIFSMRLIETIEGCLEPQGYSIIVCDCGADGEKELTRLHFCASKLVDGIILMSSNTSTALISKALGDIPLVLIDRVFPETEFDSVTVENEQSTYLTVSEALQSNDDRIAVIAGPQHISTARARLDGVKRAISDLGREVSESNIHICQYQIEDGYRAAMEIAKNLPDVVFASNYDLTVGAIKAFNELKLIIGKDVCLIGFDNLDLINVYPYSMTVISQPMEQIGMEASECLLERMKNPDAPLKSIVLPNRIITT